MRGRGGIGNAVPVSSPGPLRHGGGFMGSVAILHASMSVVHPNA